MKVLVTLSAMVSGVVCIDLETDTVTTVGQKTQVFAVSSVDKTQGSEEARAAVEDHDYQKIALLRLLAIAHENQQEVVTSGGTMIIEKEDFEKGGGAN